MKIKPVMLVLILQLFNAAPWALADEQQVIVPIPTQANQPPLPEPLPRQAPYTNIIWEAGKTIQVCLGMRPCSLHFAQGNMPPLVGQLLRVEPSIPIAGARASWLAFSASQISLCAMKRDTPDIVCRELDIPNMAGTRINIEPRGPAGHYALRYRYQNNDRFTAVLDTPLLVPMANAMAQEISAASSALGEILSKQTEPPK